VEVIGPPTGTLNTGGVYKLRDFASNRMRSGRSGRPPPRVSQMFPPRQKLFLVKKLSPVKFMSAAAAAITAVPYFSPPMENSTPCKTLPSCKFTVVTLCTLPMRDLLAMAKSLVRVSVLTH